MAHLFMCFLAIYLLWKNVYLYLLTFFIRLGFFFCLFVFIKLYELFIYLEINPLSVTLFANVFSHSVCCLFMFFFFSFAVQGLLGLIRPHFLNFIFVFLFITLGGRSKRYCCDLCQREFCLFSSKSFIVFSLTFKSLIHFEFILCIVLENCSNFILSHVAVQFSQHHLLKRFSFSHWILLPRLM